MAYFAFFMMVYGLVGFQGRPSLPNRLDLTLFKQVAGTAARRVATWPAAGRLLAARRLPRSARLPLPAACWHPAAAGNLRSTPIQAACHKLSF